MDAAAHRLPERPRRRGAAAAGQRRGGRPGGRRTVDAAVRSPATTATSTRRGCCWTTARRSIGRRRTAETPLYAACEKGHVDAARLLLDNGAEVDRADKDGWTPLCTSPARTATSTWRGCCWTTAREVDRAREDGGRRYSPPARTATSTRRGCCWTKARRSTGRMKDGWTPLYVACENGHVDAARLLLDKGAEVDRATEDGADAAVHRLLKATSTRRGCCWTKARRSIGRSDRRNGRRCTSPARTATSTRRGCCWTTARRSTGRGGGRPDAAVRRLPKGHVDAARLLLEKGAEVDRADEENGDAADHRLPEGPRRRGAAAAGQRRGGRPGDEGRRGRRCTSPAGTATSTRRGCCWTTARRSTGRRGRSRRRCTAPARRATSTRRGCCWTKARRSTSGDKAAGRRCTSPAGRATSTRRGWCWRKARRSTGR